MPFPPELPEQILKLAADLGVREEDIEQNFIRGGGKGGQKINKTASMVQLFHGPTGIEVRVQKHREQSKNRVSAYKLLLIKIEERVRGRQSKLQQAIFKSRKQKARRSRKAKNKMLQEKHHRSGIKEQRKSIEG